MKEWMETPLLMAVALAVSLILVAAGAPFWAAVIVTIAIFLAADYYHYKSKGGHDDE
jgi:hypothetical protein